MVSAKWVVLIFVISLVSLSSNLYAEIQKNTEMEIGEVGLGSSRIGGRALMGFKETPNGGNITYDCSPSGPCVPCAYFEKNDKKYRCSETGYRIPLKCVETDSASKEAKTGKKAQKDRSTLEVDAEVRSDVNLNAAKELSSSTTQRTLLDDLSTSVGGRQAYITYRSCIPAVKEEKLSVLGFEEIMIGLLFMSGSAIYFRRKRANATPSGAVRVPNNSRF